MGSLESRQGRNLESKNRGRLIVETTKRVLRGREERHKLGDHEDEGPEEKKARCRSHCCQSASTDSGVSML